MATGRRRGEGPAVGARHRLADLDLGLVGQGQVVADDNLLARRQAAAAVDGLDLDPLVVLQAGVHV
jgi:hypothetical protein